MMRKYSTGRIDRSLISTTHRAICLNCRRSKQTCKCGEIRQFAAGFDLVILIHPKENRKRVGTGRLTHLCIENSVIIEGTNFSNDAALNSILDDSTRCPILLYPGAGAVDVSQSAEQALSDMVPEERRLTVIVLDASWFFAKKMLRLSANLHAVKQIKFDPPHRSNYKIRRQPNEKCFSSIEATHFLVDALAHSKRWATEADYTVLLNVFNSMVDLQLAYVQNENQRALRGNRGST